MPCIVRNNNGQVTDVLANNGKSSKLFEKLAELPFIKDRQKALAYYSYTLTNQFTKTVKDKLVVDENNEPILVFKNLSENNTLLNTSGLLFTENFREANEEDIQNQGVVFGFVRKDNLSQKKSTLKSDSAVKALYSEAVDNMDKQDTLELVYPNGNKQYAIKNPNYFIQLDKYNKNVTTETYDGFMAHLEKLGFDLGSKTDIAVLEVSQSKPEMLQITIGGTTIYFKDRVNPISGETTGEIELDLIETKKSERKKGNAGKALETFLNYADKQGKDVYLMVSPRETGITEVGLIRLYKKYGFESISKFLPQEMIRRVDKQKFKLYENTFTSETIKDSTRKSYVHRLLEDYFGGYGESIISVEQGGETTNEERIRRETSELKKFAVENNIFTNNIEAEMGFEHRPEYRSNAESIIYYDPNNKDRIIKEWRSISPYTAPYNGYKAMLGRILLQNYLFPETAYDIITLTEKDGIVNFVLSQPFIYGEDVRRATEGETNNYMENMGYERDADDEAPIWEKDNIMVFDLYGGNVLKKGETIFVIDPLIEFDTEDMSFNDFINTTKAKEPLVDEFLKKYEEVLDIKQEIKIQKTFESNIVGKERQSKFIVDWAKKNGVFIEDVKKEFGVEKADLDHGNEALLYFKPNNRQVIYKELTPNLVGDYKAIVDRIDIQNKEFPETGYDLLGISERDGYATFVLAQPFIEGGEKVTEEDMDNFMSFKGFRKVNTASYQKGNLMITDLETVNAKKIGSQVYVIDMIAGYLQQDLNVPTEDNTVPDMSLEAKIEYLIQNGDITRRCSL